MGLDMYAGKTSRDVPPVDFEELEGDESLHIWRKHPNLHGWMEKLYREKGGKAESFNCVPVRLTLEDLAVLESDIKTGALPQTSGFFFGRSDGSETADDLKFIADAREAIAAGMSVYYSSWW